MTNNSLFKETKLVNTYINYFITVYYIYENVGNGIVNNNAEILKKWMHVFFSTQLQKKMYTTQCRND